MRNALLRITTLAALVGSLGGCSTTKLDKVQKVTVESDPPGAVVFVNEKGARRALGRTPMTVDQPYEVNRMDFSHACWILPAAGLGGVAVGLSQGLSDSTGNLNPLGFVPLTIGLLAAAEGTVFCGIGAAQDGDEIPIGEFNTDATKKRIEVELAGHATQSIDLTMPGPDKKLALFLPPVVGGPMVATAAPLPATPPLAAPAPRPTGALVAGAPQPNTFALVIGIERYRDVPSPTGARADAERFAALAKSTLGVPERNVILALDDRASHGDLEKHLRWLENNVPAGGRIYLFFAGHGAPDAASGTSYLLPYDADPADLPGTALKLSDVTGRLGKTKARDVVAFLDACFSGTGGRSVLAAGTRPLVPVAKLEAAPHVSVLAAVTGAQISGAVAGGKEGLFSHYLAEALGDAKADLDGDGQISLRELHDWIKPRVEREAKRDSRDQVPSLVTGDGVDAGSTVLAIGVAGG